MSLLAIKQVCKSYACEILNNITFHVDPFEVVSIVGKSGSGKSTLFNLIAQLEQVDSGEILLNDYPNKIGQVGYMQQKDLLLPYYNVLENCMLPLKIKKDNQAKEKATAILNDLKLIEFAHLYPHELSGGMRQRVSFARTLLTGCQLILLDEPFSALDMITKRDLQQWYVEMAKQYQLTTLLITHDIEEALLLSHKVLVLSQQKIIKEMMLSQDKATYANSTQFLQDKSEIYKILEQD